MLCRRDDRMHCGWHEKLKFLPVVANEARYHHADKLYILYIASVQHLLELTMNQWWVGLLAYCDLFLRTSHWGHLLSLLVKFGAVSCVHYAFLWYSGVGSPVNCQKYVEHQKLVTWQPNNLIHLSPLRVVPIPQPQLTAVTQCLFTKKTANSGSFG